MHSFMLIVRKAENLSASEFRELWHTRHGGRFGAGEQPDRSVLNYVVESAKIMPFPRASLFVDGVEQFEFVDAARADRFVESETYVALIDDLRDIAASVLAIRAESFDIVPRQRTVLAVKRMSILQRQPNLTRHEFQHWWLNEHGPKIKMLPDLRMSRQHHLQGLCLEIGDSAEPLVYFDGLTELGFDDMETMSRLFPPTTHSGATSHAAVGIQNMTTLILEEQVLGAP